MSNVQELRRKIKSIKSTAKLTKAMQMVAASKMNKAIESAIASRAYSNLAWSVLESLGQGENRHPLLEVRPLSKKLLVVFTSNKGLAGGFNTQIIKKTLDLLDESTDIVTIGRKGKNYFARFYADKLIADFEAPDTHPKSKDAEDLVGFLRDSFLSRRYSQITTVYNVFKSTSLQVATSEQIFPIKIQADKSKEKPIDYSEIKVEPNPKIVIDYIVPRVILAKVYQIFLDSTASEHASRMLAMKNATDNAKDILEDLTLTYQGIRQAGITREIIEVSAGASALQN